jgi:tetratricopeptide (TPR) repeat protein
MQLSDQDVAVYNAYYQRAVKLIRARILIDGERRPAFPGWFARRDLKKGIQLFEAALAIAPHKWECRFWIGKALQRLGDHRNALSWFSEASRQEPDNPTIAKEAANAALELGEADLAIAFLRPATTIASRDAALHYNLGLALLMSGRPREALEATSRSAALTADKMTAWLMGWIEDVLAGRRACPKSIGELRRGA